jgi:hypothetical protein
MKIPNEGKIRQRLDSAIAVFLANDAHLLRVRTSERSMCHKLAEAIQQVFRSWHVDCEYNRDGKLPKELPKIGYDEDHSVFPDIIVHRRGIPENLLVIEAKCTDSSIARINEDKAKLNLYLRELNYHYAALVTFDVGTKPGISYELQSANKANEIAGAVH